MENKIEEELEKIIVLLNERRIMEAKKILKELSNKLIENENRLEELKEFASEVKRRMRSAGRSMSIGASEFEDIFVKYKISL